MMTTNKVLLLTMTIFLVGCASRESSWFKKSSKISLSESEQKVLRVEAMNKWSQRYLKENLEESLSKFELIHAANPSDLDALVFLTRGYYLLADAHLDDPNLKKINFEKATSYGELAMATNEAFKQKMLQGKSVEESLSTLGKKEVPAMYWTAASLGKWAKASGIAAQLKYKGRIRGLIEKVEELEPNYFYNAPKRYWGAFYAIAPSFAGGDLNKSKINFDKSLKASPEYLGTSVLMAEVYWSKKGDKKTFEKVLKQVLQSNADKHPDLGPENKLEKIKAEKLLQKIDDIF